MTIFYSLFDNFGEERNDAYPPFLAYTYLYRLQEVQWSYWLISLEVIGLSA